MNKGYQKEKVDEQDLVIMNNLEEVTSPSTGKDK